MSTPAILFAIYFFIGFVFLIVAIATRSKERRAKAIWPMAGTDLDVAVLFFIALLWPVWLLWSLFKSEDSSTK